jgi:hypothetical protein
MTLLRKNWDSLADNILGNRAVIRNSLIVLFCKMRRSSPLDVMAVTKRARAEPQNPV